MQNTDKLVSVRNGFATNSSSVHNIIQTHAEWHSWSKKEIAKYYKENCYKGQTTFGWEQDTHYDLTSIINYAILVTVDTNSIKPEHIQDQYLKLIVETFYEQNREGKPYFDAYVDHGSEHLYESDVENDEEDVGKTFWNFVTTVGQIDTTNDNI